MTTAARRHPRAIGALGLAVATMLASAPAVDGQQTFTVDRTHMTGIAADDDPSPGACDPGDCSLREAIIAANTRPGRDTITFEGPGVIALARVDAGSESESTNDLDITDDVTIVGVDGGGVEVTPAAMSGVEARAFDVRSGAVVISDLLLRDGESTAGGGAVRVQTGAELTLRGVVLRTNSAALGGAVHVDGGGLTVEDSTFDRNTGSTRGGAIAATAATTLDVSTSVFDGNTAGRACCGQAATGGSGGAVSVDATTDDVSVDQSTFTLNSVEEDGVPGGQGGALHSRAAVQVSNTVFEGNGGPLTAVGGAVALDTAGPALSTIDNSTLVDNEARTAGGALVVTDESRLRIEQSSIAANRVTADDGGRGGGISLGGSGTVLEAINTTISANQASLGGGGIHIIADQTARSSGVVRQPATQVELTYTTLVGNGGTAAIYADAATSQIRFASTIISGSLSANCLTPQASQLISLGHNLESAAECNLDQPTDITSTDPMTGPLHDGTGRPQGADGDRAGPTHPLLEGSPAIDAADPGRCPDPIAVDQRAVARPQLQGCDIGAHEVLGAFDVALSKSVAPPVIETGGEAVFTLSVTNPSPSTPGFVVVTDTVPDGLLITEVATTQGTCDPPAGQTLICSLGEVQVGSTVTVTIGVTPATAGRYRNTATAVVGEGGGDDDAENNADSVTLTVQETAVGCTGGAGPDGPVVTEGITRIDGLNRIQTAVASSLAACGDGQAPAVVLTRSDLFPDAQAGTPLAVSLGAPLLLSQPDALSAATEEEIRRVLPAGRTVALLGGEVALSSAVEQRLGELGYTTVRYAGLNRFETATAIAEEGLGSPATVLVADGGDFADSIVAGAASAGVDTTSGTGPPGAGVVGAAILLTSSGTVPPETREYLDRQMDPPTVVAIGAAAAEAFPDADAVSGPTRFETAVAVAERFFDSPTTVGIARADDFPDGLSGGALVGRAALGPGPIILTAIDRLPAAAESYLNANTPGIERALIFGGTAAVSPQVEDAIARALEL